VWPSMRRPQRLSDTGLTIQLLRLLYMEVPGSVALLLSQLASDTAFLQQSQVNGIMWGKGTRSPRCD